MSSYLDENFENTWEMLEDDLKDLKRIFEGTKKQRMDDAKIAQLYAIAYQARQFQGARQHIERALQSGTTPTDEQIGAVRICEQRLFQELGNLRRMEHEETKQRSAKKSEEGH